MSSKNFSPEELTRELKTESKILGLPEQSAEQISGKVIKYVLTWLENRDIITKSYLESVVTCELDKYSKDLAFLYQNRNKII